MALTQPQLARVFLAVHDARLEAGPCLCKKCEARKTTLLKAGARVDVVAQLGHVLDDDRLVRDAAAKIGAFFQAWKRRLIADLQSRQKKGRLEKAWARLRKGEFDEYDPLEWEDVDEFMEDEFGEPVEETKDLSRLRWLLMLGGVLAGIGIARKVLGGKAESGKLKVETQLPTGTAGEGEWRAEIAGEVGDQPDRQLARIVQEYADEFSRQTIGRVDEKVRRILNDGVDKGQGVATMADRLSEMFDQFSQSDSLRIAQTEYTKAIGIGMMQKYAEQGIEYVRWENEPMPCPICAGYAGRVWRIEDVLPHFPGHPRCRCSLSPCQELVGDEQIETDPPLNVFDDPELRKNPWDAAVDVYNNDSVTAYLGRLARGEQVWKTMALPADLRFARPWWKNIRLEFASDADKALFIVGGRKKRRHEKWLAVLREWYPDLTDAELRERGAAVRDWVHEHEGNAADGVLQVPDQQAGNGKDDNE